MSELFLDCQGLRCPEPIIKMSKYIKKEMKKGDRVKVVATDIACKADAEAWCRQTGNRLIEAVRADDVTTIVIEKTQD